MKLFITISLIMSSLLVTADVVRRESDNKAYLVICPVAKVRICNKIVLQQPAGCLSKIHVNGREMPYKSELRDVNTLLNSIVGAYQFHGMTKSRPFSVSGFALSEIKMGAYRDVFHVETLENVNLPR